MSATEDTRPALLVSTNNRFHLGWLLYLLGQPRPERQPDATGPHVEIDGEPIDWADTAGDGWDMAAESGFLPLHDITAKMSQLGQITVNQLHIRAAEENQP